MRDFLPIGEWAEKTINFILENDHGVLAGLGDVVGDMTALTERLLQWVPDWLLAGLFVVLGFWRLGWKFAATAAVAFVVIIGTGFWPATMVTLALIIASTLISLLVGIPLGIAAALNRRINYLLRPVLDFMQTMPAFVYLIPAAMVFGLGRVPAVLATVIFAMPPVVRLTALGIRQVNKEQVEAGITFGCTPLQVLLKIQIPGALPSIMAGINQTIMMALSMVIIASMVGGGGLGNNVLASIQRLDIGLGFESGLAVVLLAIILDRLTESFGVRKEERIARLKGGQGQES
ncbi:ABC transporter permease [Aromatoleum petrolei]|uniref:ABC transporter permease subunit n=1 Tax=Aromatoleum petrolei TaxID=76116 RepID=A0ABX1MH81_9RHOO|nr:ABC transporter permease subunit [Aromatoleum petrolei]NMF87308.1 ABC transporter permease subunit [Aromatoleum petrolei]QTQ38554.1 ABC transporter, permease protein [Aromatoleum petrolei]